MTGVDDGPCVGNKLRLDHVEMLRLISPLSHLQYFADCRESWTNCIRGFRWRFSSANMIRAMNYSTTRPIYGALHILSRFMTCKITLDSSCLRKGSARYDVTHREGIAAKPPEGQNALSDL